MKLVGVLMGVCLLVGCGVSPAAMMGQGAPERTHSMRTAGMMGNQSGPMRTMSATSSAACAASMGLTTEAMLGMMASGSMRGMVAW